MNDVKHEIATYSDIIFYDFEVFPHYWCVVFNFYDSNECTIVDTRDDLLEFYNKYKNMVFVGYNSRSYDLPIFRSILRGVDPYSVSTAIIGKRAKISVLDPQNARIQYPINNYDAFDNQHSLKQLEAFMGMDIRETEVDFNLNRPLTPTEIEQTHYYCKHDVMALKKYFKIREELLGSFESHAMLINEYNLPREYFNKTGVQLTSIILGAVQQHTIPDEFDIEFPSTLKLNAQNRKLLEFYQKPENKCYRKIFATDKDSNSKWKREQQCTINGVPHILGYGGIHGSVDNSIFEGTIFVCDVASEYPNFMDNYNALSRKVVNPRKFTEIKEKRLKYKAEGNPKNKALKPVINGTFGATKDKNNPMYDPMIANKITVGCQALMLDLLEKVEPYSDLIQSNTDGIYLQIHSTENLEKVKEVAHEWEKRTGFELEYDVYDKIVQANVNNYIMIKHTKDGKTKYKAKGGFFKPKTLIDNDLPIVTEAIINYFVYGTAVEETIANCNELIKFQKVIKLSDKYHKVVIGKVKSIQNKGSFSQVIESGEILKGKVHRVFASTNPDDNGIWKIKKDNGLEIAEKLPYTSKHVFIDNGEVTSKTCPPNLDRQFYIDLVNDRIKQILTSEEPTIDDTPQFLWQCMKDSNGSYIEFLKLVSTKININTKAFQRYIVADCCKCYGNNKKLLDFIPIFSYIYQKRSVSLANLNKKFSPKIATTIAQNSTLNVGGKTIYPNHEKCLIEVYNSLRNDYLPIKDILLEQANLFGRLKYTDSTLDGNVWIVQNYSTNIKPTVILYQLSTGKIEYFFVEESFYKLLPIVDGDIIRIFETTIEPCKIVSHKDEKGINVLTDNPKKSKIIINRYEIIHKIL
jgi:DNA polymerase